MSCSRDPLAEKRETIHIQSEKYDLMSHETVMKLQYEWVTCHLRDKYLSCVSNISPATCFDSCFLGVLLLPRMHGTPFRVKKRKRRTGKLADQLF